MPKRPNWRAIKIHRNYTVEECAAKLGIAKGTVLRWIKRQTLPAITDSRPFLILGGDLKDFGRGGRKAKQKCQLDECYCFTCRAIREPAARMADLTATSATVGDLAALCAHCSGIMHKRVAEKRQAIITQAVTKGLNPAAPMKPSGIDWLGDIPAHWEVKRLKHLVVDGVGLQMGPFGGMLTDLAPEPTGFKLYGQENTISGDFSLGHRWLDEDRYHVLSRYQLFAGDLVITRKGSLGSCRRFPENASLGIADSDTIIIRFDEGHMRSIFAMLLLHDASYIASQIEQNRRGAILSGLNTGVVGDLLMLCPPPAEQDAITDWCRVAVERMDSLRKSIRSSIESATEYRSALITAAVTGQIEELR